MKFEHSIENRLNEKQWYIKIWQFEKVKHLNLIGFSIVKIQWWQRQCVYRAIVMVHTNWHWVPQREILGGIENDWVAVYKCGFLKTLKCLLNPSGAAV